MWRETEQTCHFGFQIGFQSTPSVWRETFDFAFGAKLALISIHSLRVEGDASFCFFAISFFNFNPLPPCGGRRRAVYQNLSGNHFNPLPPCGGRLLPAILSKFRFPFQSTPSVWRETNTFFALDFGMEFQSTPSVWRETCADRRSLGYLSISIHSLRVEGDLRFAQMYAIIIVISIHSLRVEGDAQYREIEFDRSHFNPLPPCGGRHVSPEADAIHSRFQSTPSVWRETNNAIYMRSWNGFQSTPSVWRETLLKECECMKIRFQSTPSVWRETTRSIPHPTKR